MRGARPSRSERTVGLQIGKGAPFACVTHYLAVCQASRAEVFRSRHQPAQPHAGARLSPPRLTAQRRHSQAPRTAVTINASAMPARRPSQSPWWTTLWLSIEVIIDAATAGLACVVVPKGRSSK